MAIKLSEKERVALGSAILSEMGDVFYEPWEWDDTDALPEGYDRWNEEAIAAWWHNKALQAADGALGYLKDRG